MFYWLVLVAGRYRSTMKPQTATVHTEGSSDSHESRKISICLKRLWHALMRRWRHRVRVEVLSLSDPRAFAPSGRGERRIVFNDRVILYKRRVDN